MTRHDMTRQDKARQDKTRQDQTRPDKTRLDKTNMFCFFAFGKAAYNLVPSFFSAVSDSLSFVCGIWFGFIGLNIRYIQYDTCHKALTN